MSSRWFKAAAPEIKRLWRDARTQLSFFANMGKITRFYCGYCKRKAAEYRADEDSLTEALKEATRDALASPIDVDLLQRRSDCRLQLEDYQTRKIAGKRVRTRLRWKAKGDLVSREFFLAVRDRGATAPITARRNSNGDRITDRAGMETLVLEYYSKLYSTAKLSPQHDELETRLLAAIPSLFTDRFPPETMATLGSLPTSTELHATLKCMANGKILGPDGVIMEFYRYYRDLIGSDFTTMLQNAIQNGTLPTCMNSGLIILLPKDGDLKMLPN